MRNKFGLKIILLGILLICLGSIHLLQKQHSFSEYVISESELENIKMERTESSEPLLTTLNFNDNSLFYDSSRQTYYYSLIDGDADAYNPFIFFKAANDDVCLAMGPERITEEVISSNTSITIIAYDENCFSQYSLKCTTLPLMNITCEEEIFDDAVPMQLQLFDNRRDCTIRNICSDGLIHLRGATTKRFPKKGYRISLTENKKNGNIVSNKSNLLGMRNDDDWILYAGYNDQEKVRHVFSTNLWKYSCATDNSVGLDVGMEYHYVELFVNQEYYGLYALGYPLDEKQFNIKKESDTEFLYKKTSWDSELSITEASSVPIPGYITDSVSSNAWLPLKDYYVMINSKTYSDNENLYESIDIDNAIDIYLFYNFIQAADNVIPGAMKNILIAAKYRDGKYKMIYAPWDMDISWGNDFEGTDTYPYAIPPSQNWLMEVGGIAPLIDRDDPNIRSLVQDKYKSLRESVWSEKSINHLIDQYEVDIFDSGAYLRDMERWPDGLYSQPEMKLSLFREHVMQRLTYMDIDYHYNK